MTQYIEPTNDERRRWQGQGACIYCGLGFGNPNDDDKCRCRFCDSCTAYWIADVLAPYADTEHGPVPRRELCPSCATDELEHVKRYVKAQLKLAPIGSGLEIYYFDALCELLLIERDLVEVPVQTIETLVA